MRKNKNGISLIELLVVMAILALILAALFKSYILVLKQHVQQSEISTADISDIIGLELLKKDITMAGFGLPYTTNGFNEAESDSKYKPDPSDLNCNSSAPRAFSFSNDNNTQANNSDVLVIRSTVAAINNVTGQWGIVNSTGYTSFSPDNGTSGYFSLLNINYRFIGYTDDIKNKKISNDVLFAFGLTSNISKQPRMPFNRVDYYLKKPNILPKRCLPTTYELYRATINQSDGYRDPQPILDCVKDFQVSFFVNDGVNKKWQSYLPVSAKDIREQVKLVKIFILYQLGSFDSSYTYPFDNITLGDSDTGPLHTVVLTNKEKHCRWHIIILTIKPLNLEPLNLVE